MTISADIRKNDEDDSLTSPFHVCSRRPTSIQKLLLQNLPEINCTYLNSLQDLNLSVKETLEQDVKL